MRVNHHTLRSHVSPNGKILTLTWSESYCPDECCIGNIFHGKWKQDASVHCLKSEDRQLKAFFIKAAF